MQVLRRYTDRLIPVNSGSHRMLFFSTAVGNQVDRKTYNPRWAGKSSNVVTIEAIEATLPLILGRAEQIPE